MYEELIDKVESYLTSLKEEGQTHLEVTQRRKPATAKILAEVTGSRPEASTASPAAQAPPVADVDLALAVAQRLPECGGPNDATRLLWISTPEEFEGALGRLLEKMLYALGYGMEGPPSAWSPAKELLDPAASVLTMGQAALDAVCGKRTSLTMMRGKRISDTGGRPITPTFAPSYMEKNPAAKKAVWNDMLELLDRNGIELPEWSAKFRRK